MRNFLREKNSQTEMAIENSCPGPQINVSVNKREMDLKEMLRHYSTYQESEYNILLIDETGGKEGVLQFILLIRSKFSGRPRFCIHLAWNCTTAGVLFLYKIL